MKEPTSQTVVIESESNTAVIDDERFAFTFVAA